MTIKAAIAYALMQRTEFDSLVIALKNYDGSKQHPNACIISVAERIIVNYLASVQSMMIGALRSYSIKYDLAQRTSFNSSKAEPAPAQRERAATQTE